jgi:hypothetical protein
MLRERRQFVDHDLCGGASQCLFDRRCIEGADPRNGGACLLERLGTLVGVRHSGDCVALANQFRDQWLSDGAACARNENVHSGSLQERCIDGCFVSFFIR